MKDLLDSILFGTLEEVKNAVQLGRDDVNAVDAYGFTPLIETAIVNDQQKMDCLLQAGARVNDPDMTGGTALHWVCNNSNYALAKFLLERGANANAFNNASQPILISPILRNQRELKELLYRHGADLKFAQDYINAKLIGHRFELQGCVELVNAEGEFIELDLEGFFLEFSVGIIQHSMERFRHHFSARQMRKYFKYVDKVILAFAAGSELIRYLHYNINVDDYSENIKSLLKHDPILLPVGYEGHAVTFMKCGKLFAKCDRGELSKEIPSVVIYDINNPAAINFDFCKKMLYTRLSKKYVEQEYVNELELTPLVEFHLSSQKSGNCSWANVEAAVPAILFMLLHKRKLNNTPQDIAQNKQSALDFYHEWLRWDKEVALHECAESFYYSTPAAKAAKAALLMQVLFQACDYKKPEDVEQARKLLRILTIPQYDYILKSYIRVYCREQRTEEGMRLLKLLEACGSNFY